MADITLVCPTCAKHVTISEYVESGVACPQCGRVLDRNTPLASGPRPKLATMSGRTSLVSEKIKPEEPPPPPPLALPPPSKLRALGRKHSELQLFLVMALSWIVFAGLLGGLLYWEWKAQTMPQWLEYWKMARWVFAGIAWVVVLVPAFQEGWLQGTLNLLVPAYSVYYALNKLDYAVLRAIFFAVLFALGAEFYFLPNDTLFHIVQQSATRWSEGVRDLIRNTGHKMRT